MVAVSFIPCYTLEARQGSARIIDLVGLNVYVSRLGSSVSFARRFGIWGGAWIFPLSPAKVCVYNLYDGSEARNYGAEARLRGTCYSQDAPSINRGRSWLTCPDILSLTSVKPISTSFENHFARIFGTCLIVFPSSCLQSSFRKPT